MKTLSAHCHETLVGLSGSQCGTNRNKKRAGKTIEQHNFILNWIYFIISSQILLKTKISVFLDL